MNWYGFDYMVSQKNFPLDMINYYLLGFTPELLLSWTSEELSSPELTPTKEDSLWALVKEFKVNFLKAGLKVVILSRDSGRLSWKKKN